MKRIIVIMAIFGAVTVLAQSSRRDEKFVKCAAEGGLLEVKLGHLALAHAESPKIKELAKAMITDYASTNEELKNKAGVYITQLPIALTRKDQKKYDKLAKRTGLDFDEGYEAWVLKEHKKEICEFKKESKRGSDPLKTWAGQKVAVLEGHLEKMKGVNTSVN